MRKLVLTLLLSVGALPALAGSWTVQHIGPFDYYNNDNGTSYTGQRIGGFYYLNGSDGHSYVGQRIGQFEYWSGN